MPKNQFKRIEPGVSIVFVDIVYVSRYAQGRKTADHFTFWLFNGRIVNASKPLHYAHVGRLWEEAKAEFEAKGYTTDRV